VCLVPTEFTGRAITESELRVDFAHDADSDPAAALLRKPVKIQTKPIRTVTGERRDNADAAPHMQINFCPDQLLLNRCARCRLIDPDNPAMSFWVLSDTADSFQSSMIQKFELYGGYDPKGGDIWVWVAESLTTEQRKSANPPPFKVPDGTKKFAIISKDDMTETVYVSVVAECLTNMKAPDPTPHSRRTGFFIMKGLKYC
jgi:hypothetical protein